MGTYALLPDELKMVESTLSALSERAKFQLGLDSVLQNWGRFVTQVERGYDDSIYEYTNDLTTRDTIQQVLSDVPEPVRVKLAALVKADDDRFFQATRESPRALGGRKDMGTHPWWFRIPRRMGDELKNDLQSEGLLGG